MLKLENISYSYCENEDIKQISYTFNPGIIYGVLGHNGAGKTTLFRMILGLVKMTSGIINQNHIQNISYLPENNGVYNNLTVIENLNYRAALNQISKNESKTRIEKLLKQLKLNRHVSKKASNLSQGLKKRLAFACAMLNYGDLILLDEPTNGLDPESLEIVKNLILNIKSNRSIIIINSHDLNFVSKICDEILILQEGELIYSSDKISDIEDLYLRITSTDGGENEYL
ncbi:ABC transporter ATP-binding protein [Fusibacter bizertensis]